MILPRTGFLIAAGALRHVDAYCIVVRTNAARCVLVRHSVRLAHPDGVRFLSRVDVRAEVDEVPARLFLFVRDEFLHLCLGELGACVLHAVRDDDDDDLCPLPVCRARLLHVQDGITDGVEECRRAARLIRSLGQRAHISDLSVLVETVHLVVKEHRRHAHVDAQLLFLLDHRIKATDGVRLQSVHGSTLVEDHHEFNAVRLLLRRSRPRCAVLRRLCGRHGTGKTEQHRQQDG